MKGASQEVYMGTQDLLLQHSGIHIPVWFLLQNRKLLGLAQLLPRLFVVLQLSLLFQKQYRLGCIAGQPHRVDLLKLLE